MKAPGHVVLARRKERDAEIRQVAAEVLSTPLPQNDAGAYYDARSAAAITRIWAQLPDEKRRLYWDAIITRPQDYSYANAELLVKRLSLLEGHIAFGQELRALL